MHAFLFVGQNLSRVKGKVQEKVKNLGSSAIEFEVVKVGDVRELSLFTKLKVIEKTSIVVKNFDKATVEAQNAFLKALEEPQENLSYILTASDTNNILPTIISRCEVIEIGGGPVPFGESKKALEFITTSEGGKLKITSKINKREEAVELVRNIIILGQEKMLEKPDQYWMVVSEATKTLQNLEANGNVQLQLANFVVSLTG